MLALILALIVALFASYAVEMPKHSGVLGGSHPLDQAHKLGFTRKSERPATDEYADRSLLLEYQKNYMRDVKNIVIDGNNLLYYLMGTDRNYEKYLIAALEMCAEFKKPVFFVIKDLKIDFNLADYATQSLHIVVATGDAKARDDYLVLRIAESLKGKTIILTRDRYRDIHNITASEPTDFTVYGKKAAEYRKLFDTRGNFATVGRWTVAENLMGYAHIEGQKPGVYKRRRRNAATSDLVYILRF
jgi:hypothetical protein